MTKTSYVLDIPIKCIVASQYGSLLEMRIANAVKDTLPVASPNVNNNKILLRNRRSLNTVAETMSSLQLHRPEPSVVCQMTHKRPCRRY